VDAGPERRLLDELRFVHQAMVAAVVAGEGMTRVAELAAEAAGAPVAVLVPGLAAVLADGVSEVSIEDPALERWASDLARGVPTSVPPEVVDAVPVRLGEQVVAIVALLPCERAPRTDAAEFLHAAAAAMLMELAIQSAKRELERKLRGSLLEELRSGRPLDGATIVRRAARLGCDLSGGAAILCAEGEMPRRILATIAAAHPGVLVEHLEGSAPDATPRVYAALPPAGAGGGPQATLASARRLAERLRGQARVGVSSFHADPAELGAAVQEAELMLAALRHADLDLAGEIGGRTYKLLFRLLASHPEEVWSFHEATIAPVVRYEAQHGTELRHTLQAYLEANCNMSATATAIFAHRHTVAYRLERVRELTGLDPLRSEDRERLALGLKIDRLVVPGSD
jgi:hypothetical protein